MASSSSPFQPHVNRGAAAAAMLCPAARSAQDQLDLLDNLCISLHQAVRRLPKEIMPGLGGLREKVLMSEEVQVERYTKILEYSLHMAEQVAAQTLLDANLATPTHAKQVPGRPGQMTSLVVTSGFHTSGAAAADKIMKNIVHLKGKLAELDSQWKERDAH